MNPTQSDVHVNVLMTNFSLAFMQDMNNFVADRVFPTIPVLKASDRYATYSRADFNRNQMKLRGVSAESAGGGYKIDTSSTYSVDDWGLHRDIDARIRQNADAIFNLDADATRWLTMQYMISREVNWASAFFANVWTSLLTGVAAAPGANQALQWNDPNSSPIIDIRKYKTAIQLVNGVARPNKLVLGRPVWDVLCDHPDFIDRIKYGQTPGAPAIVARQACAELFELDEVLVMDAIINTGGEGITLNALESNSFIGGASGVGGKAALLVYVDPNVGPMTPTAGVNFSWTGALGNTTQGNRILSYYIPQIRSTRVEMEAAYTFKLTGADMGGYLASIIA